MPVEGLRLREEGGCIRLKCGLVSPERPKSEKGMGESSVICHLTLFRGELSLRVSSHSKNFGTPRALGGYCQWA